MKYTILCILMFYSVTLFSQNKALVEANKNFDELAYIDAQKIYLKVANDGYRSQNLFQKLGDSYYFNSDLKKAALWYGKLIEYYRSEIDPEYLFRYSQSLKSLNEYEYADSIMQQFEAITVKDRRGILFAKKRDYLKFINEQSGKFRINSLSINSKYSDFAPSFNDDQLVFASSMDAGINKPVHLWNDMPFLDLYSCPLRDHDDLGKIKKIQGEVNTPYHESSATFSSDGMTMYFTRNNYNNDEVKTDDGGTSLLKIFKSKFNKGEWQTATELPFNNDNYSTAHPSLSRDGRKLYFTSDMPGGYGMSDLYVVVVYEDGTYGKPFNLGKNINTEGRENFPYISNKGRLYFSSDGHVGLGGLDVFVVQTNESRGRFSTPFNVGAPINSPEDDFSFIINEYNEIGFFASNRPGGKGNDDIYGCVQTEELIVNCNQHINGVLLDEITDKELTNVEVVLFDEDYFEIQRTVTDQKGRYRFEVDCLKQYITRVGTNGEYSTSEVLLKTGDRYNTDYRQVVRLKIGKDLGLESVGIGDDLAKILQLEPIYFDFNKSDIRSDASLELQKVIITLKNNPDLKIQVRSHTDSRSDDDYNLALSEKRSASTVRYIIDKGGISPDRISGKGYGETNLVNGCRNGVKCSDEDHQLNRRSEFIVTR